MLGSLAAVLVVVAEGSSRIRFRASRTFSISRWISIVLKVEGCGGKSATSGDTTFGGTDGRTSWASSCAPTSLRACSLRAFSVSFRRSSEMGNGPNLSSVLELNACGSVRVVLLEPCGISEPRRPVDSSHEASVGKAFEDAVAEVSEHQAEVERGLTNELQMIVDHSHNSCPATLTLFPGEPFPGSSSLTSNTFG